MEEQKLTKLEEMILVELRKNPRDLLAIIDQLACVLAFEDRKAYRFYKKCSTVLGKASFDLGRLQVIEAAKNRRLINTPTT